MPIGTDEIAADGSTTHVREYCCFLSYRHSDNRGEGRQWATWLQHAIETYEVPADLVGTRNDRGEEIPSRLFPVFRDEEELPADSDLSTPILRALKNSRCLLVLCSPGASQSRFVADEIVRFKAMGKSNRVIAAIIAGEPNVSGDRGKQQDGFQADQECFPLPLRYVVERDGTVSAQLSEPIAADFRLENGQQGWTTPEAYRQAMRSSGEPLAAISREIQKYDERLSLMKLKVIAGILGVPLGRLTQRDRAYALAKARKRARTLRNWLAAVTVLSVIAVLGAVSAWYARGIAVTERTKAEEATRSAQQLAQQRKKDADLLVSQLIPFAIHAILNTTDLETRSLAFTFVRNTKVLMNLTYDPESLKKSFDAAVFCNIVAASEMGAEQTQADHAYYRSILFGGSASEETRRTGNTALLYATRADEIFSQIMLRPDLRSELAREGIGVDLDTLSLYRAEAQISKGGALINHLRDYDSGVRELEKFVVFMDEWKPLDTKMKAVRYYDLAESLTTLSHAYRLTGRDQEATEAMQRALDSGEELGKLDSSKQLFLAVRYVLADSLGYLDETRRARMETCLTQVALTPEQVDELRASFAPMEVVILSCAPDGNAATAGLRPGDVIVEYAGNEVADSNQLKGLIGNFQRGNCELRIRRDGAILRLSVPAGKLGINTLDRAKAKPWAGRPATTPAR